MQSDRCHTPKAIYKHSPRFNTLLCLAIRNNNIHAKSLDNYLIRLFNNIHFEGGESHFYFNDKLSNNSNAVVRI